MAKYKYSATDAVGKMNKGMMDAENPEDLREKLRKKENI